MQLADELLLLAYTYGDRDDLTRPTLDVSLTGAALIELALTGRLTMDGVQPVAADPTPTGDHALDTVLSRIAADAPDDLTMWLHVPMPGISVGGPGWKVARRAALANLVETGALRPERRRVLGIFPRTRYLPAGAEPAAAAAARCRLFAVVDSADLAEPRTAALAVLVIAAGLIGAVFPGRPEADVHKRIMTMADRTLDETAWPSKSVHTAVRTLLVVMPAVTQTGRPRAAGGSRH